ncbi:MAG: TIGR02679 domain-containing protein, partial [Streptosporangiaceae bacterium]
RHAGRVLSACRTPTGIAELASAITGDAHGLDDAAPAAAVVLRGLAIALDGPPPASTAERRLLWQRVDVSTDEIAGTVITYGLRPPGTGRWPAMMRERADLGPDHPLDRARAAPSRRIDTAR